MGLDTTLRCIHPNKNTHKHISANFTSTKDLASHSSTCLHALLKSSFSLTNAFFLCVRQNMKIMTGIKARKRKGNKQQLWSLLVLNKKTFIYLHLGTETITTESEKLTDGCTTKNQRSIRKLQSKIV